MLSARYLLRDWVLQRWGHTDSTRAVTDWLIRLEALRYGRNSPDSLATLQRAFRQLPWPKEPPP